MSLIWYIYSNDIVSGPFSTESIEAGLKENKWTNEAMIWWKGQREWVSIETWRKNFQSIVDGFKTNIQQLAWYVEHLGAQKGPMNVKELHSYILANGIIGSCRVWTNGMEKWTSIFEINELVNYFGITRRKHPRAPFKGDFMVRLENSENQIAAYPGSISAGGLGVKNLEDVNVGDLLAWKIKSPLLSKEIEGRARVVYTNIGGYTGLEFQELDPDYISVIKSYVDQFKAS
jgi:hypothetical protein